MAHPEECVRVGLHTNAARASFSIIAVPHMVLYDCPSTCPIAKHMLVPSELNCGRERVFLCISYPNISYNVLLKNRISSLMWTGWKRWLPSPCSALRQRINRLPVLKTLACAHWIWKYLKAGAMPFDLSPTKDWIILETLVYVIAPSPENWNKREER